MFELSPLLLISLLKTLPSEVVSILSLLGCYLIIFIMARFFKKEGLLVYNVLAIIVCNMQVLKAADFSLYSEPVALGTMVFATSFLTSDLLTELYSASYARKSIAISFISSISVLIMMTFALGYNDISGANPENLHFIEGDKALSVIFIPNLAIVVASLTAYGMSQLVDIHIFSKLKKMTNNSKLWLRTFLSFAVASLMDSIIFNFLAWKVFAPYDISWHSLVFNYMVGGYVLLLIVALCNIAAMYLISKTVKVE